MASNSVHATIENVKKKNSIYVPSQWITLIFNARKRNPYVTIPLKYNHVTDFKSFVQKQSLNFQTKTTNEKVNWLLMRWLQVRQDAPKRLYLNYMFDDSQFLEVITQHSGLRKKGRPAQWPETDADHVLQCKVTDFCKEKGRLDEFMCKGNHTRRLPWLL